jgi:hypothetical protein
MSSMSFVDNSAQILA